MGSSKPSKTKTAKSNVPETRVPAEALEGVKTTAKTTKAESTNSHTAKPAAVKTHRTSAAKAKTPTRLPQPVAHIASAAIESKTPLHGEIAELAYSYWEERGCTHGQQHEDWLRAETVLRAGKAAGASV